MADDIKNCRDLEAHLAPYVDGEETPEARRSVAAHLAACPPCLELAEAERSARDVIHAHRNALQAVAPAELRARCASLQSSAFAGASAAHGGGRSAMSSVRRWVPLSLAATLVLAIAGVFVFGLDNRVEALAASLAVDHVKCFKVSGKGLQAEPAVAERDWQQDQGWPIVVPPTEPALQLKLIDVRRCFSSDGRAAHLMYTYRGVPLSVYVIQEPDGNAGRDRVVEKLGQEAVIWCANRRTYAVVGKARQKDLSQVVEYMKAHVR
jgi:anti-sigma factor (TIGR02949 family)